MDALNTLFPVLFLLALGFVSRIKEWITPEQKEGANAIIFNILFPFLIFNLMATASFNASHIGLILYAFIAMAIAFLLGKLSTRFTGKKYSAFSPYLISVMEGGNVALPLYMSIVGESSNTVIFDIACSLMCFVVFPILVAKQTASGTSGKQLLKTIFTNSFVLAVIAGLALNLTGIYAMLEASAIGTLLTNTMSQVTTPIVSMILFILGYNLRLDKKLLLSISPLMALKTMYYAIVIAGFFLLFPTQMSDPVFRIAPIIYFMSPTGFGLIPIITPLFKDEDDEAYTSGFVSMYILITLIVYTGIVLFL